MHRAHANPKQIELKTNDANGSRKDKREREKNNKNKLVAAITLYDTLVDQFKSTR